MDKIELKIFYFCKNRSKEEDYTKIIKKLKTTFGMIDQMNELDLDHLEPPTIRLNSLI